MYQPPRLDLSNCDNEPIHIPGLVQPHGVLVVVSEPGLIIRQISANSEHHFAAAAQDLLGTPLSSLLAGEDLRNLTEEFLPLNLEASPAYLPAMQIRGAWFEPIVHRYDGATILEFEAQTGNHSRGRNAVIYTALKTKFNALNRTATLKEFCDEAALAVRDFIGFDRVMIYRFLEDGAGHVFAEARRDDLEPYLNLHFPAADIPLQARTLYLKQWLRFKVDVDDISAPLVPVQNPDTGKPLDLSYAVTRAMSPIHTEYLKNIGALASMSISIIYDDKLWGLIACHHYSPRYVPHAERMAAEITAHFLSLQVGAKELAENYGYMTRLKNAQNALIEKAGKGNDLVRDLCSEEINLLSAIEADGAAVIFDDEIQTVGITPTPGQLRELAAWLWENHPDEVFSSADLALVHPPAECYRDSASGILAARITAHKPEYLLWFRGEFVHTVNWAGDPNKPVIVGEFGDRLTPRKSFALWQESVTHTSKSWLACEIEHARSLRRSVIEIVLLRAEELRQKNEELERSNIELDAFAYVASHDLKEPLRGIHNYSLFLLEDYADKIDDEGRERLQTLVRLSERMEELLDTLLHYSRLGRTDLNLRMTNVKAVIDDSLILLQERLEATGAEIRIPQPLGIVLADAGKLGEVFVNLITNALKYNDKLQKWVEIGVTGTPNEPPVFYVRDNGIGIDAKHYDTIFHIFRRLHGREQYGGGVGAGLTIVKKIIERHGGRIWIESESGKGATFYFTLA
ncbi:MAG: ATP-binding protein [Methylobacter sp.]|nr:ATP-binding protein [Methylobacter sp.]